MKFTAFNFHENLGEGIRSLGFEEATPVQQSAIPAILEGKDIIASAQTGTGKTAAFLLPVIQQLIGLPHDGSIKALIIVPTRELAIQIDQQMEGLSYFTGVSSIPVYGGTGGTVFSTEQKALSEGADMVICTPGRMIAHINMGYVKLHALRFLILDEADRMLDMGFYEDIQKILKYLPAKRQNMLFSATLPHAIIALAKKILHDPFEINISRSKPAERVKQGAYILYKNQKTALAEHLLQNTELKSVLIFCGTKEKTTLLTRELRRLKVNVAEIHSDIQQQERENTLNAFKSKTLRVLVATDILSRGIDVDDIDLVVNYDVPHDAEDYIHRVGRTARAANEGMAITLVSEEDQRRLATIETFLGAPIPKYNAPEALGEVPAYHPERFAQKRSGGKRVFRKKPNRERK